MLEGELVQRYIQTKQNKTKQENWRKETEINGKLFVELASIYSSWMAQLHNAIMGYTIYIWRE